jgi:hypothetical protein
VSRAEWCLGSGFKTLSSLRSGHIRKYPLGTAEVERAAKG